MHRQSPTAGIVLAASTAVIWGGMFVVGKSALGRIDAFHLTALRYAVASAILLALLAAVEGRGALRLDGRGLRLWLYGSAGFAGFNLLAFTGLRHARPESASLIVAFAPLVTALVLWARTRVPPRRFVFITFPAALLGVALVISRGDLGPIVHARSAGATASCSPASSASSSTRSARPSSATSRPSATRR